MAKPAFFREKPDEHFIQRVKGIKKALKGKPWKVRFLELNPEWNNIKDLGYLNRVYLLRTADVYVTEQLEAIASEFSHSKVY